MKESIGAERSGATPDLARALETARRIANGKIPHDGDTMRLARALLSSAEEARRQAFEEAATMALHIGSLCSGPRERWAARKIAGRIRSIPPLSPKPQEQSDG